MTFPFTSIDSKAISFISLHIQNNRFELTKKNESHYNLAVICSIDNHYTILSNVCSNEKKKLSSHILIWKSHSNRLYLSVCIQQCLDVTEFRRFFFKWIEKMPFYFHICIGVFCIFLTRFVIFGSHIIIGVRVLFVLIKWFGIFICFILPCMHRRPNDYINLGENTQTIQARVI